MGIYVEGPVIYLCPKNHGLLKRFGTAEVLRIVCSAMSFKMEVNKDMGSSASAMADWCCIDAGIDPSLPSPTSISHTLPREGRPSFSKCLEIIVETPEHDLTI